MEVFWFFHQFRERYTENVCHKTAYLTLVLQGKFTEIFIILCTDFRIRIVLGKSHKESRSIKLPTVIIFWEKNSGRVQPLIIHESIIFIYVALIRHRQPNVTVSLGRIMTFTAIHFDNLLQHLFDIESDFIRRTFQILGIFVSCLSDERLIEILIIFLFRHLFLCPQIFFVRFFCNHPCYFQFFQGFRNRRQIHTIKIHPS